MQIPLINKLFLSGLTHEDNHGILSVRIWKFQVSTRHSLQVSLSLKDNEWEDFRTYCKAIDVSSIKSATPEGLFQRITDFQIKRKFKILSYIPSH